MVNAKILDINSRLKMNHGGSIPLLGLGVWQIPDGKSVIDAVSYALKIGYRHIDTAKIYGNEVGVGQAIKNSGIPREELFVTTKLWNSDHHDPERAFDESLSRLGLDYIDLYLIHWPLEGSRSEAWKALEKLVKTKRCRAIGVSNYTVRHLQELLKTAKTIPAVNQVEFHPYLYQKELLEFCKSKGIILEAYSPLARGRIITDKRLSAIASNHHKTPAQIVLRWAIEKGIPIIPKSQNPKRISENADIFDIELSPQDVKAIDSMDEKYHTTWDPSGII